MIAGDRRPPLPPGNGGVVGSVLVDGFFEGTWALERSGAAPDLAVSLHRRLPMRDRAAVEEEGARLLSFVAPDAEAGDVRLFAG